MGRNVPQTRARRALRFAVVGLGVLALAAIVAGLWLRAAFPAERLTPLLRAQLARHLDAPVALRRAEIRLFPVLAVALDDLVIGDPRGYRRPASWPRGGLASAKRAEGSLALVPLLSRRIEIEGLRLEDAAVTAVRNEDGVGNWEGLGGTRVTEKGDGDRDGFDLAVKRFDLQRASFRHYDARDGLYLAVRQVDAALSLRRSAGGRDERLRLLAELRGLGGRTPWPLGERPIRIDLDVEHGRQNELWRVRKAALTRGRLTLSGTGTITGPERVVAFKLDQSTLPLGDVLELLPKDQVASLGRLDGTGTVRLAGQARGPTSRGRLPVVRVRAALSDGRLAFRDRALALEGLAFDLAATEQGADLARLSGRLGRSTFELSGVARGWADPRVRGRIRAAADLADLSRFLPLADSVRLAGQARVDVEGAGRPGSTDPAAFGWSGRVDLAGVSASGLGLGRPLEGVAGSIGLAPGRAWATGLRAKIGRSDVTLDGTVERPFEWFAAASGGPAAPAGAVARVTVRSRRLDLDELLPTGPAEKPLPPVRVEGTFEVGSLKLKKLDATRARGRFTYASGVTAIDDCALDAYGGTASGTAWIDFRDRARPHYKVDGTAQDVDANALVSAWTPAKDVAFGTLRMTIDLDGTGLTAADVAKGLSVKGLAQVLGGKLAGASVFAKLAEFTGVDRFRILSFRDLSAPFKVVAGRVVFDPLALSTNETDWLARGSVGLDGTLDFAIAGVVPPELVPGMPRSLVSAAGSRLSGDGRLTIDLKLGGNVRRPALSWDPSRTASRLLEGTGLLLVDKLVERLGGNLGDSLAKSATIEEAADRVVAAQQQRLEEEVERRKEELERNALAELTKLFEKKAPPPPPPAAPPDSAAADATSTAPPVTAPTPPPPAAPDTIATPDTSRAPAAPAAPDSSSFELGVP